MKPYYERGGVTLYLGDNRDVLPLLGGSLCVVTDQPYGTGWARATAGDAQGDFHGAHERPEWDVYSEDWLALVKADAWAIFCPDGRLGGLARHFPAYRLRYYLKTNPRPPMGGNDTPSVEPILVAPRVRFGTGPAHFAAYNGDSPFHPCQKPEALMRWLVEGVAAPEETVVDPFMGSGTTPLVCALLGRRAIGIEAHEPYAETAARRIDAALDGVTPAERKAGQVALFGTQERDMESESA